MDTESADLVMQLNDGHFLVRALHVATELGVADQLGDGPVPVAVVAAQVGAQADPLARILRLLASRGIFALEGGLADGTVRHTPASRLLAASHPQSLRPMILNTAEQVSWRLPEHMLHMVKTGEPAMADGSMWSRLEVTPERARLFDAAMMAKAHIQIHSVLETQDFSGFGTVVDIGGGKGHLLRAILERYPAVKGVLFDRPDVVASAAAGGDAGGRLSFVGGDFFADVPSGDLTILMDILHDWTDAQSLDILRTVRRSAKPGAALMLVELEVEADGGRDLGKLIDVVMMTIFDGRQRSKAQFGPLLASAGFQLTSATPTPSGSTVLLARAV